MKRSCLAILFLMAVVAVRAQERTVLLAANRAGQVEVLDPETLQTLGSVKVLPMVDGLAAGPGGMLFLREGLAPDFRACCALYALEIKTQSLTKLLEPVAGVAVSPDGKHVVTQRGNVGVEVFDARTLQGEPALPRSIAPGMYGFSFSPNGRLLFGASNFPSPTLDVLDLGQRKLVRQFTFPNELAVLGAWVGDDYYVYGFSKTAGQLWRVRADGSGLEAPLTISFPDAAPECREGGRGVLGAGGRLFIFERFGSKLDRRTGCGKQIPGGAFEVDTQTGRLTTRLAPQLHIAQLIPSADGQELYGLDVRDPGWSAVSVVRLNATTGQILAQRDLLPQIWFIALATMPEELVPRGQLQAKTK